MVYTQLFHVRGDSSLDYTFEQPVFERQFGHSFAHIHTLTLLDDNKIMVGGEFNFIFGNDNGAARNNIARLHLGNVTVSNKANIMTHSESKLYPNPAREFFNLSRKSNQPAQVRIYDMLGRMVQEQSLNGTQNTINIKHLNKGLYSVQLLENNRTETLKLLVD